jgi:hypothetical protein
MEIEFNPGNIANTGASQPQSPVRRETIQPAENNMSFDRTQALEQTLKETPQVRPDVVARASALVSDVNYPSDELLNKLAGVLARNINGQQS